MRWTGLVRSGFCTGCTAPLPRTPEDLGYDPRPSIYPNNMSSQVGTFTEPDAVGRQFEPYIKAGLYLPAPPLPYGAEAGLETQTASIQRRAVRREYCDARPTTARDCHALRRARAASGSPARALRGRCGCRVHFSI